MLTYLNGVGQPLQLAIELVRTSGFYARSSEKTRHNHSYLAYNVLQNH